MCRQNLIKLTSPASLLSASCTAVLDVDWRGGSLDIEMQADVKARVDVEVWAEVETLAALLAAAFNGGCWPSLQLSAPCVASALSSATDLAMGLVLTTVVGMGVAVNADVGAGARAWAEPVAETALLLPPFANVSVCCCYWRLLLWLQLLASHAGCATARALTDLASRLAVGFCCESCIWRPGAV